MKKIIILAAAAIMTAAGITGCAICESAIDTVKITTGPPGGPRTKTRSPNSERPPSKTAKRPKPPQKRQIRNKNSDSKKIILVWDKSGHILSTGP